MNRGNSPTSLTYASQTQETQPRAALRLSFKVLEILQLLLWAPDLCSRLVTGHPQLCVWCTHQPETSPTHLILWGKPFSGFLTILLTMLLGVGLVRTGENVHRHQEQKEPKSSFFSLSFFPEKGCSFMQSKEHEKQKATTILNLISSTSPFLRMVNW